jgi:hypothetical protein
MGRASRPPRPGGGRADWLCCCDTKNKKSGSSYHGGGERKARLFVERPRCLRRLLRSLPPSPRHLLRCANNMIAKCRGYASEWGTSEKLESTMPAPEFSQKIVWYAPYELMSRRSRSLVLRQRRSRSIDQTSRIAPMPIKENPNVRRNHVATRLRSPMKNSVM